MRPKTQFAHTGTANIAFQVVGDGPLDLVSVPGVASHVEMQWADPIYARFLTRLGAMARLIVFDRRGAGASDPVDHPPSMEERVEDIRAVMNAAASERAVILGFSEGGSSSAVFAATYPERCRALILCEAGARGRPDPNDEELPAAEIEHMNELARAVIDRWGSGEGVDLWAPSLAGSALHRRNFGLFERAVATREAMLGVLQNWTQTDVTDVLPTIRVPTLVLHRRGDFVPISHGRYIARHVPNAKFVELEGHDHLPYAGDAASLLGEIEQFLAELRGVPAPERRGLGALLFTDIVGSTARLAELGDERWRDIIETHDTLTAATVEAGGGTLVKFTGDGALARFEASPLAIRCAWSIREQMRRLGLDVRAGIHSGEFEQLEHDLGGLAVHVAARIADLAGPGDVLVSREAKELAVGSGIELAPRGTRALRGVPHEVEIYALEAEPPLAPAEAKPEPSRRSDVRPNLSFTDRVQVGFARRAPALTRTMARLAG